MSLIKKVFKDCHTGLNNLDYDWAKVTGTISITVYLIMCFWHLRDDDIFEPVAFASGLSIIVAAVCGGVAIKRIATPAPTPSTTTSTTKVEVP
jgi:hypothetical protein